MFPLLRVALRIQDMLILLAIGCILLGVIYLIDQFRAELKKSGIEKTNFTPWQSPHFHFLMMALMVGTAGVLSPAGEMFDVLLYDAYLIIPVGVIGVVAAAYFLFVSLVYFMARRMSLIKWMAVLHLVLSAVIGLAFYQYYINTLDTDAIFSGAQYTSQWALGVAFTILIPFFSVVQFLLPLNLLISWWRRR